MRKEQAYHICRAAAAIAGVDYVFVFGSNAIVFWLDEVGLKDTQEILGVFVSRELDISVSETDEKLNLVVDASIGELSYFDETFGVYAHANIPQKLFKVPKSWVGRTKIEQEPVSRIKIVVPHPVDLVFSKMLGAREKDWVFCENVVRLFNINCDKIRKLAEEYLIEHPEEKERVEYVLRVLEGRIKKGCYFSPAP